MSENENPTYKSELGNREEGDGFDSLYFERMEDDNKHRKFLVNWVVCVSSIWLFFVLLLLVFSSLSDEVLIALLCTCTANILGLPLVVLKGIFK